MSLTRVLHHSKISPCMASPILIARSIPRKTYTTSQQLSKNASPLPKDSPLPQIIPGEKSGAVGYAL